MTHDESSFGYLILFAFPRDFRCLENNVQEELNAIVCIERAKLFDLLSFYINIPINQSYILFTYVYSSTGTL